MDSPTRQRENRRLAARLGEKLEVRGRTLADVVRRAGRALPKRLQHDADALVQAEFLALHPKLRHLADSARSDAAEERLRRHARLLDPDKARNDRRLGWLAGLAFNLLALAGLIVAVLYWRGFIGPGA